MSQTFFCLHCVSGPYPSMWSLLNHMALGHVAYLGIQREPYLRTLARQEKRRYDGHLCLSYKVHSLFPN